MFGLFRKKKTKILGKAKDRFGNPIYIEDLEAKTIAGAYIHFIGLINWGPKGEPKYRFLENDTILEIENRAVGRMIGKKGNVIRAIKERFGNGEDDPFQVREWKKEKPIVVESEIEKTRTRTRGKRKRKSNSIEGVKHDI